MDSIRVGSGKEKGTRSRFFPDDLDMEALTEETLEIILREISNTIEREVLVDIATIKGFIDSKSHQIATLKIAEERAVKAADVLVSSGYNVSLVYVEGSFNVFF